MATNMRNKSIDAVMDQPMSQPADAYNKQLIKEIQYTHDETTWNKLIQRLTPSIHQLVLKFHQKQPHVTIDDYEQTCWESLVKAVYTYDLTKPHNLFIMNMNIVLIRIMQRVADENLSISNVAMHAVNKHYHQTYRSQKEAEFINECLKPYVSLDLPTEYDAYQPILRRMDQLVDHNAKTNSTTLKTAKLDYWWNVINSVLTQRELEVVVMYYGLTNSVHANQYTKPMTYQAIGNHYGVTKQYINALIKTSLRKLRKRYYQDCRNQQAWNENQ